MQRASIMTENTSVAIEHKRNHSEERRLNGFFGGHNREVFICKPHIRGQSAWADYHWLELCLVYRGGRPEYRTRSRWNKTISVSDRQELTSCKSRGQARQSGQRLLPRNCHKFARAF